MSKQISEDFANTQLAITEAATLSPEKDKHEALKDSILILQAQELRLKQQSFQYKIKSTEGMQNLFGALEYSLRSTYEKAYPEKSNASIGKYSMEKVRALHKLRTNGFEDKETYNKKRSLIAVQALNGAKGRGFIETAFHYETALCYLEIGAYKDAIQALKLYKDGLESLDCDKTNIEALNVAAQGLIDTVERLQLENFNNYINKHRFAGPTSE